MPHPSFIAVDWGTTGFRLWVMDGNGDILTSINGPFGMSRLKLDDFDRMLEQSLSERGVEQDVFAMICGIAGRHEAGARPHTCQHQHILMILAKKPSAPAIHREK